MHLCIMYLQVAVILMSNVILHMLLYLLVFASALFPTAFCYQSAQQVLAI
jgi:hypothetical protein